MVRRILVSLAACALAVTAAVNGYRLTLTQKATLHGTTLAAGAYTIEVRDNKAIVRHGRTVAAVPVRVENTPEKIQRTSVRYEKGAIQEIQLAGTNMRLLFTE